MRRLDISGLGELSLTVQHHMGPDAPRSVMRLLPGSTLWPGLLLLRLQADEGGALSELIVLPDSLPREQFRKLAVAITTIARRDSKCAESHKIH